jgi:hypothetical protein
MCFIRLKSPNAIGCQACRCNPTHGGLHTVEIQKRSGRYFSWTAIPFQSPETHYSGRLQTGSIGLQHVEARYGLCRFDPVIQHPLGLMKRRMSATACGKFNLLASGFSEIA